MYHNIFWRFNSKVPVAPLVYNSTTTVYNSPSGNDSVGASSGGNTWRPLRGGSYNPHALLADPTPKTTTSRKQKKRNTPLVESRKYLKAVWKCNEEIGCSGVYFTKDGMNVIEVDTEPSATGFEKVAYAEAEAWLRDHPVVPATRGQRSKRTSNIKKKQPVTDGMLYLINADCVNAAYALQDAGYNPIITNAGSRRHFGGGYANGARAQEEELCRRSLLPFAGDERYNVSLLQFTDGSSPTGSPMGIRHNVLYPLPPSDAIYTPSVPFIRRGAPDKYRLLEEPRYIAVGTVAAHNLGNRNINALVDDLVCDTYKYFTSLLTAGLMNGHDSIVLVPVGCGAFQNPPAIVAKVLLDVIERGSFLSRYRAIVMACLDDHNTGKQHNPNGNFSPIQACFESSKWASGRLVVQPAPHPSRDVPPAMFQQHLK